MKLTPLASAAERIGTVMLSSISRQVVGSGVMTEVGGQAAFYVNPFDVDDIKQTIIKVIDDEESRNEHIALGLENTKRFSLCNIVAQYKKIYKSLI